MQVPWPQRRAGTGQEPLAEQALLPCSPADSGPVPSSTALGLAILRFSASVSESVSLILFVSSHSCLSCCWSVFISGLSFTVFVRVCHCLPVYLCNEDLQPLVVLLPCKETAGSLVSSAILWSVKDRGEDGTTVTAPAMCLVS